MNNLKIGGEFEINPKALSGYPDYLPSNNIFLYSSGRSALIAILKHTSKSKVPVIHIPYFICQTVYLACTNAGFQVKFYDLNETFNFPIDYLSNIKTNEVLLTLNYFGFVNDNPTILIIKSLRSDITIISDQVQSFWTYDKTEADYSFTSLRKHFPIPEGALVFCKNEDICIDTNMMEASFYKNKLIGSFLKYQRLPDSVYLNFFADGEKELDNNYNISKASSLSNYLYQTINLEEAKAKRKKNCQFVYEFGQLNGLDFVFPYNDEIIPLNVPIILENRDRIRKKLMVTNIFLPIHWPLSDFNKASLFSNKMEKNELSLVIDQRYSHQEIEFELQSLIKAIKHA